MTVHTRAAIGWIIVTAAIFISDNKYIIKTMEKTEKYRDIMEEIASCSQLWNVTLICSDGSLRNDVYTLIINIQWNSIHFAIISKIFNIVQHSPGKIS